MGTTWLRALAAVAGLALMITVGQAQGQPGEQSFKQIRLTEKQVQGYLAAQKQIAPLADKLEASGDKEDPALQKQVEKIAKANGFASLEELGTVGSNISIVLSGLDPQTGKFTEPPDQIRRDMEELKQDKEVTAKAREKAMAEMQDALKVATPLQFKENIAVVKKYQKELEEVLASEDDQDGPGND